MNMPEDAHTPSADAGCTEGDASSCGEPEPSPFLLQHESGYCVHPFGGNMQPKNHTPAVLHPSCKDDLVTRFTWLSDGRIKHLGSGACLQVASTGASLEEARLEFVYGCGEPGGTGTKADVVFERTSAGAIRHVKSGLCVHPALGFAMPEFETELVLRAACDEPWLAFTLL